MLKAVFSETGTFKKIIDSLKDIASECNIQFDDSGLNFQTMDVSHVALCECSINISKFEEYQCEYPVSLGINFNSLTKLLKCVNPMDKMTMIFKENNRDKLNFEFVSTNNDKISQFEMKLMDIDQEQLGIPDQEYDTIVTMPSSEFQNICNNLILIDDTVNLTVSKQGISFESLGELGKASIQMKCDSKSVEVVMNSDEESISSVFALRYFNFFSKATPLSPLVIFRLKPDFPIVVEYHLDTIEEEEDGSYIKYYLAPKMED